MKPDNVKQTALLPLILTVILTLCASLSSCKTAVDPFESFTVETGKAPVGADGLEDFYSLTMPESYDKYGTFCITSRGDPL